MAVEVEPKSTLDGHATPKLAPKLRLLLAARLADYPRFPQLRRILSRTEGRFKEHWRRYLI